MLPPLSCAPLGRSLHLLKNPTTMLHMARHAPLMRIAIPLDAVRAWFIANTPPSKKAPQDITITLRPPAIGIRRDDSFRPDAGQLSPRKLGG